MNVPKDSYRVEPGKLVPSVSARLVDSSAAVLVPTAHGLFATRAWAFADGSEHLSLQAVEQDGTPRAHLAASATGAVAWQDGTTAPAVRIHSECATGDIFGSYRCDCGPQLEQGLATIQRLGGYLIYVRNHEGRGIGLVNKLRAYALQDEGQDTLDANLSLGLAADERDYRQTGVILKNLGLNSIRLISNNPAKKAALTAEGIEVAQLLPNIIQPRPENKKYLETKRARMHHYL